MRIVQVMQLCIARVSHARAQACEENLEELVAQPPVCTYDDCHHESEVELVKRLDRLGDRVMVVTDE